LELLNKIIILRDSSLQALILLKQENQPIICRTSSWDFENFRALYRYDF